MLIIDLYRNLQYIPILTCISTLSKHSLLGSCELRDSYLKYAILKRNRLLSEPLEEKQT